MTRYICPDCLKSERSHVDAVQCPVCGKDTITMVEWVRRRMQGQASVGEKHPMAQYDGHSE